MPEEFKKSSFNLQSEIYLTLNTQCFIITRSNDSIGLTETQ